MAYRTFIARATDGFPLVEAQGEAPAAGQSAAERARGQVKQLLTRLHSMPKRCSIQCSGGLVAHIVICDGLCFAGLFCQSYPPTAAFAFVEDVRMMFAEEIKREFGTGAVDYRSCLEVLEKPYHFARFDRHVARISSQYRDPGSSTVLAKLQANLVQVSHIMRCNMEELLLRGDSLESVTQKASSLKAESKRFGSSAKLLSLQALWQRYWASTLAVAWLALLLWTASAQEAWASAGCCCVGALCSYFVLRARSVRLRSAKAKQGDWSFVPEYQSEHLHML